MHFENNPAYPTRNNLPLIQLRVWEGDYAVPSVDPSSLIAMTVFKIFNVKGTIEKSYFPFISSIPSFRQDNFFTDDKTTLFKHVFKMCNEESHLSIKQQRKLDDYKNYFVENFAEPFYFDCWIRDSNYNHSIKAWFENVIPFPFSRFYLMKNRQEAQKALSFYRARSYESYMRIKYMDAAVCLGDFNYLLKDGRKFIYKNVPTSLDAIVYSFVTIAMHIPLQDTTLQTLINRHVWLVKYANRITEEYFPNTSTQFKYIDPNNTPYERLSNKCLIVLGASMLFTMFLYAYLFNYIEINNYTLLFRQPDHY